MAEVFKALKYPPQMILTSPAKRALQTAEPVATLLETEVSLPFQQDARLYEQEAAGLLPVIHTLPDSFHSILWVGHNPTFEWLASLLCWGKVEKPVIHLSTACLAHLEFAVEHWPEIQVGQGILRGLIPARVAKRLLQINKEEK